MKYKEMLDKIIEKLEVKDEILTKEEFKFIMDILKREQYELEEIVNKHVPRID